MPVSNSGIYKIRNRLNGKYYVGSSIDIDGVCGRFYHHKYKLVNNCHHSQKLQNAWNKYGESNFIFEIIELTPESTLEEIEQRYLDIAKKEISHVYNISFVAYRIEMTDEIKNKISLAQKERLRDSRNHHMFSKNHKQETKDKISKCLLGRYTAEENPNFGKHHSEDIRKTMGRKGVISGNKNPRYDRNVYRFVNRNTAQEFLGTRFEFMKKFELKRWFVDYLVKGKIQETRGWEAFRISSNSNNRTDNSSECQDQ